MPHHAARPLLRRRRTLAALACGIAVATGAGVLLSHASATGTTAGAVPEVVPPTAHVRFDYQLGGAYPPPAGVGAVSRDRGARPADGHYNVCYVNAFQTQPDALDWWETNEPDLLLRDGDGEPVEDDAWGEALLDTSTATKRSRLAKIVGGWIDGCATSGFQAVEPDNLDSHERSDGLLTPEHNAAFAKLLADRAHAAGLAIGQKNTTDLLERRKEIGFDFAVVEECGRYDECGDFADAYDDRVFVVEYADRDFARACASVGTQASVVRRDLDVVPAGRPGYVHRTC
ncbi:endo alpha-1,4 polygalactosaminidase [Streptomyces californicus]|uniref:Endo alpha-1,4 polygalactosaminidase n=1 Tax=Streptomyces californicus TaxID=67351 RepID=A0ABD7D6M2_9ACTN|nr:MULTISPECIES: endo alpha-1,4 polygalactosaminidase [Streptomyces]QRV25931.1 endo alpha-1,4 polygalactosaminidase [Streptomyces californicus]QRV38406.1 endo alpha-1,4 polygalactosaminidase [Streptomyces californicus]QRV39332.1 endo alpha-1,4 polygalactosaminidase [Streptomyces californicus]QRV46081.1 endo alpha-1,4 polygalactosaminidase [Streptomyces californicus]